MAGEESAATDILESVNLSSVNFVGVRPALVILQSRPLGDCMKSLEIYRQALGRVLATRRLLRVGVA